MPKSINFTHESRPIYAMRNRLTEYRKKGGVFKLTYVTHRSMWVDKHQFSRFRIVDLTLNKNLAILDLVYET